MLSAASCTTTGLAHMVKPLLENEETNKILTASMSTVHAVTNSQAVLDSMPKAGEKDLRKNRSILNNIILTSTNAAAALAEVIPEVKNIGFMADSIRVPTNTESLIVLNVTFQSKNTPNGTAFELDTKIINRIYQKVSERDPEKLLVFSMEQNVSSDLDRLECGRGDRRSVQSHPDLFYRYRLCLHSRSAASGTAVPATRIRSGYRWFMPRSSDGTIMSTGAM